jgi:hypothetical protein
MLSIAWGTLAVRLYNIKSLSRWYFRFSWRRVWNMVFEVLTVCIIRAMMETVRSSETSVNLHYVVKHPKDGHLQCVSVLFCSPFLIHFHFLIYITLWNILKTVIFSVSPFHSVPNFWWLLGDNKWGTVHKRFMSTVDSLLSDHGKFIYSG